MRVRGPWGGRGAARRRRAEPCTGRARDDALARRWPPPRPPRRTDAGLRDRTRRAGRGTMKRKSVWVLVLAVMGAAFDAGNVLATDAVGGFAGKTLAQATLGPLDIRAHTVVPADPSAGKTPANVWETMLKTKGDTDMYVQQNTWPKHSSTGWHTHPGPSLVVITQGSVTVYDASDPDCAPHVYTAGAADNSFVDIGGGDVHVVRNETDDVAIGYAVQFVPAHAARRITEPQPANCSVS